MHHHQSIGLNPLLYQPTDRAWLGAEVVSTHQPIVDGWRQQGQQVTACLDVIIGIAKVWWHHHPRPMLRTSLLCVPLADSAFIIVGNDH